MKSKGMLFFPPVHLTDLTVGSNNMEGSYSTMGIHTWLTGLMGRINILYIAQWVL